MAEFTPTIDQAHAIEARGRGILVSAAAGSGKTKVLTERLMGYLTETPPKSIDSFLIITYTRAAAGELRGRILNEITKQMARDPGNGALRRQYALVGHAQISTIHGFCANLIREHCLGLGLSPDFKIAEQDRMDQLKQTCLTKVLEKRYESIDEDAAFRLLADTVGAGRDDARLESLVLALHTRMQSHADPAAWAAGQRDLLFAENITDAGETLWGRELLESAARDSDYWANAMDELLATVYLPQNKYIADKYGESLQTTAESLREFSRAARIGWEKAAEHADIAFPRLGSIRSPEDPELVDSIKAKRESCKTACKDFGRQFAQSSQEVLADLRRTAPAMKALLELTLDFDKAFSAEKRRRNVVDYGDLEHFAAKLLATPDGTPTELALQIRPKYTEIMVDEYQDVNAVQELIFRCVSRDGTNLFCVGDVKQSIYRFRLADPTIFTRKYVQFPDYHPAQQDGNPQRILLQENFRSRHEILDAANAVFENIMSEELGELVYDDCARLRCGALQYQGEVPKPTLYLIDRPGAEEGEESPDTHACEAAFVARKIRELVDGGIPVTDGSGQRPVRYGDIALLMRSANTVAAIYRQALEAAGIPVQSEQGGGYYDSPEITLMSALLAVIDNPEQDVPLIAVLRSPYLAFTPDELAEIRAAGKQESFYDALCLRGETDEKCRDFLEKLRVFRAIAPDLPLRELLWRVYQDLDILTISAAMEDGADRCANLTALIDLAAQFESSQYQGLRSFVQWLNRQAELGNEPNLSRGESGNAVQIMSIHRSKGLEFPVVFLCDTARRFNFSDTSAAVLVHPQLGLGPKVTDLERGIEYPTTARKAIEQRMKQETRSEEMRLLYVAMTRAKEYLYMTGVVKDSAGKLEKFRPLITAPMSPQILRNQNCLCDWLISAALADGETHLRLESASMDLRESAATAPVVLDDHTAQPELLAQLRESLAFRYPHQRSQTLPSKVTATELKHLGADADPEAQSLVTPTAWRFRSFQPAGPEETLTPTERGTAVHLVFQHINLQNTGSLTEIENEIARLTAGGYLTARQASCIDSKQIAAFFASEAGQCMRSGDRVLREFKFSLLCPAEQYFPGAEEDEVLLQGVIDCAVESAGAWTIIDYKTDILSPGAVPQRAALYRSQVDAYAMAMERITGLPVKRRILYFLHPGISVEI